MPSHIKANVPVTKSIEIQVHSASLLGISLQFETSPCKYIIISNVIA